MSDFISIGSLYIRTANNYSIHQRAFMSSKLEFGVHDVDELALPPDSDNFSLFFFDGVNFIPFKPDSVFSAVELEEEEV